MFITTDNLTEKNRQDFDWCDKSMCLFIMIFSALYLILPLLLYETIFRDVAQNITWGHEISWSYNRHPPLCTWLLTFMTSLFGDIRLAVYSASVLCLMTSLFFVYRISKYYLDPVQALSACLLSTISIFHLNNFVLEFNQNVMMLPCWVMTCYFSHKAMQYNRWTDWSLLGVVSTLAVLAKYESVIIIGVLFIWMLCHFQVRYRLKLLLAMGITTLLLIPHMKSVAEHGFLPFSFLFSRVKHGYQASFLWRHVYYPCAAAIGLLIHVIPPVLVLMLLMGLKKMRVNSMNFLVYLGIAPFGFVILISMMLGVFILGEWGYPLFAFTIPALVSYFGVNIQKKDVKKIFVLVVFLHVMTLLAYKFLQYNSDKRQSTNYPGVVLAEKANQYWHEFYAEPIHYVGGDEPFYYFLAAYLDSKPLLLEHYSLAESPWINAKQLKKQGMVMVIYGCDGAEKKLVAQQFAVQHSRCVRVPMSNKRHYQAMPMTLMIVAPRNPKKKSV